MSNSDKMKVYGFLTVVVLIAAVPAWFGQWAPLVGLAVWRWMLYEDPQ